MEIKKAELIDDLYSWDNDITKEEWISILQDKYLINEELISTLYKFYLEPRHRSTCRELGLKHKIQPSVIHESVSALGKLVQGKLNRFKIIGSDKQLTNWVIPMYGQLNNNVLEWVIRPELIAAMETLYVHGDPSKVRTSKQLNTIQKDTNSFQQTTENNAKTNFSIEKYVELLKFSKNLVLTGIIGTGKTYLAKRIAEKMQAETKLVRFHAAYSYSEFIGGLRPITWWENNNERKESFNDGDFTAFCKEALQNLIDSKKTKEELEEDNSIQQTMTHFIKTIGNKIFEDGKYLLNKDNSFLDISITDLNEATITVTSIQGGSITIPWINMASKYNIYKKHKNINWSLLEIEKKLKVHNHHNVYLLFLKAFDKFMEDNLVRINAEVVKRKDYVFIIDEMNKANITNVLGEVFTAIQPSNRGLNGKTTTQYSHFIPENDLFHKGFFVPENVYIIGTINDADTENKIISYNTISKFTWKQIKAEDRIAMWDEVIPEYKDKAYEIMTTINKKIDSIPGLNEHYHIGPTYFLKLRNFEGDFDAFWDNYLKGILTRYLISQPNYSKIITQLKEACKNEQRLKAV
ncbi:AAA family ATPase [Arenibacter latericius]|uniref:AAA family ATPase n=1 Tax=Arenibacter latericius TaxID=86104 RepID=UPI0004066468|nr:AAA family ATPase [Arenibacter latericius]